MRQSLRVKYGNNTPIVVICTILCILQSFAFFQPDTTIGFRSVGLLSLGLQLLLTIVLVVGYSKYLHSDSTSSFFLFSVFAWWFLESVLHYYKGVAIFSFISPFILSVFVLLDNRSKALAYRAFYGVFFWMCCFGILAYLIYAFNIFPPLSMDDFYEDDTIAQYANYGLAYVLETNTVVGFDRLCGLFNEPGLLGTLGAFVLIIEGFRFNYRNIVIFIACIMSFSMAFYVIVFIYITLKMLFTKDYKLVFLVALIIVAILYLSTIDIGNENLSRFLDRFVFDEGRFMGDDRLGSNDEQIWEKILNTPSMLWFGYGQEYDFYGSSFKSVIIKHGIVGSCAMFLPLFIGALKMAKKNVACLAFVLCFMLSLYQRTQVFNITFFLILMGGIQYCKTILNPITGVADK